MTAYRTLLRAIARGEVDDLAPLMNELGIGWVAVRELSEVSYVTGGRDNAAKVAAMQLADSHAWQAPRATRRNQIQLPQRTGRFYPVQSTNAA